MKIKKNLVVLTMVFALGGGAVVSVKAAETIQGDHAAAQCTSEQGQLFINEGRYEHAIREFTCVIKAQPTGVEGYRGRIEAALLLGRYSDAYSDYARVTSSCSRLMGRRLSAATTTKNTSQGSSGSPDRPGPTGCRSHRSRA
jgi:hypothetical protein